MQGETMTDRDIQKKTVDRIVALSPFDREQIEKAANGQLNARFGDRERLNTAMEKIGIKLLSGTRSSAVVAICQFVAATGWETRLECMSCGQMRPHDETVCGQCTYQVNGSDEQRYSHESLRPPMQGQI